MRNNDKVKQIDMVAKTPDQTLIRLYAIMWVVGYWAVYFAFRSLLPEKALTDAAYIQELVEGTATVLPSHGFAVMASIFSLLPAKLTWIIVGVFDGYVLYRVASCVRTFRGMALMPIALIPFIGLNLQAPTKETLVVLLALLMGTLVDRVKSETKVFVSIVLVYAFYGAFIREYYLIIMAAFVGYTLMLKTTPFLRWAYILPVLAGLLIMPESAYHILGDARNQVNSIVNYGDASVVRTYFLDPFPSDNFFHFVANYSHAFAMLHFPFLKDLTIKEVILFLNVLLYGTVMIRGITCLEAPKRFLPLLFLAHITVLIIFEPDYGSYFRHFSSVILYLMPAIIYLEDRRAAFLRTRSVRI
jgi:hypothetical protein